MKNTLLLILVAVVLLTTRASAWTYLGFEQITVAATSIGFTATKLQPNGANTAPQATVGSCRVRTAQISFTVDGTTPTSSVGTLGEIGDVIPLVGPDVLRNFRAIRTGATSGQLDCSVGQP